jgi:hypothetical protein
LVCTIGGTTGRTLLNKLSPMVDTYGLLLGRGVRAMSCDKCGQVMKEGTHYWGWYCDTKNCFNSEVARLIYGARYQRERASK